MKICYLCPDLGISIDGFKGASSHIRNFVRALISLGHDVSVMTSCSVDQNEFEFPVTVIPQPKFINDILHEEHTRVWRALRHLFYNGAIEKVFEHILHNQNIDLIYERYSPFSAAGSIIARQLNIPHILEVNAPLADQGKRYRRQALQEACELMEMTAFNRTNMIVTLTDELRQWMISIGIPSEKIIVRPCGVDETVFTPEGPSLVDNFKGKTVIGFLGSLKPWHDIELLAKAFEVLAEEDRYHLLVVGDGPMRKTMQSLAMDFPDQVTLTGAIPQQEVPKYVRAMDIAVAPYPNLDLFYFSPLKVYEYMAMGKAVVATGIGQLKTLIRHGETGMLVPPGNLESFVKTIKQLAEDSNLRSVIGAQATQEIQANHTWKKRAESFIQNYEEAFAIH